MNTRGSYWINLLKGLDYFVATIFGIPAGIYISSYARFKNWIRLEVSINWLFNNKDHCKNSLEVNLEDIRRYYGSTDLNR